MQNFLSMGLGQLCKLRGTLTECTTLLFSLHVMYVYVCHHSHILSCLPASLAFSPNIPASHRYSLIFNHTPQSTKDRTSLLTVCFCSKAVLYCHLLYSTEKLKSSSQIKGIFSSQLSGGWFDAAESTHTVS